MSNRTREGDVDPERAGALLPGPLHDVLYGGDLQQFVLLWSLKKVNHGTPGLRTPASGRPLFSPALGWGHQVTDSAAGRGDAAEGGVVRVGRSL